MADGKIEIDTSINTDGAEKGVKNLKGNLDGLVKKFKNTPAVSGFFTGVSLGAKASAKAIKETTDAINTQIKAEKQLEISAKNNPYLNETSVKELKNYASQLQSISTVGDEQLLPLMSQLASTGRTQAEIQQIISTALDVSASGMMSLDSAVQSLNSSYSGNVGILGRQISELKSLTKEELESGKAVEIVADKFKGISEEVTKATGSYEQMKNAQGDFNEAVGKLTKPTSDAWNNFWKGWYERGIETITKINNWIDAETIGKKVAKSISSGLSELDYEGDKIKYLRDAMKLLSNDELLMMENYLKGIKTRSTEEERIYKRIESEKERRSDILKIEADMKKAEEERRKAEEKETAKTKSRDDLRKEYDDTIEQTKKEIEIRRSLGEEISKQDEAQELLNASMSAYIKMMSDPAFAGDDGSETHEVNARSQITQWMEDAKELPELENQFESFKKKLEEITQTEKDAKEQEIKLLDAEFDQLSANDKLKVWDAYKEARKQISDEIIAIEKAEVQAQKDAVAEMFTNVNDYVSQFGSINNTITDLMTKSNETQTSSELNALEEQYNKGLVTYQEYCDQKDEINKKSAREQYKINMWTWTASLLEATANIAQGVSKAIAQGGTAGIITGALVAAAGAAQIASITASKPIAPSFATGGIVPGNSYTGDKVRANVNSGEMILNAAQQAQLWKMANGNGGGASINMPVTIENNTGANVSTAMDQNGLRVVIDNVVKAGFQEGRYTSSMNAANTKSQGVRIL